MYFDRKYNVRADLVDPFRSPSPWEKGYAAPPVLCGIDFNVNPLTCVIGFQVADQLYLTDEILLHNASTFDLAAELQARYPGRTIRCFPDPSGAARKTSSPVGITDLTILRKAGFQVTAPPAAPPVVDRINSVNALCCNAKGERRLFVHPRCKNLIKSFEQLAYREGTSQPDKSSGLDHAVDAAGYLVMGTFPIITYSVGMGHVTGL